MDLPWTNEPGYINPSGPSWTDVSTCTWPFCFGADWKFQIHETTETGGTNRSFVETAG